MEKNQHLYLHKSQNNRECHSYYFNGSKPKPLVSKDLFCLRPSHTEHGWAHGSNTVYSVIHGLNGTSIELQPCLRYDLDSNVARVSTIKARVYSIKQCLSRFEHDLPTIFIRLFYGSKYGLVRSVTA